MGSRSFMDLKVWQLAHRVHLEIYRGTERFPARDFYGLASQMRRAAWSIPANIVEGFGRRATRDKAHFYIMAAGSTEELKYGLLSARDLGKLPSIDALWRDCESIAKMLRSLIDIVLDEGSKAAP